AVVVAREDRPGEKFLAAYVVSKSQEQSLSAQELRERLKQRLPEYMVPAAIIILERMPLTSNGKIDRKALPHPQRSSGGEQYVAPRGYMEEMLCGIWSQALGVERVGVEDNFFELGGHSLLATRVISRVRQVLGVEVGVRMLFSAPTVAGMAKAIAALGRTEGRLVRPELGRVSRTAGLALPLSYGQQRLWFLDQMEPGSSFYNIPVALLLRGAVDVGALERSLQEVVRRHEALRTRFGYEDGNPVQIIAEQGEAELRLEVVEAEGGSEEEKQKWLERIEKQEAERGIDLGQGPLLRSRLVRMGEREHVLLLVMHHIVSDGWSMGILVREMSALYEAFGEGRPSPLEELRVQYADYAVWQREWLRGEVLEEEVEYWRERLAGVEPLELGKSGKRTGEGNARGGVEEFRLEGGLSEELGKLGAGVGATKFMTLLAGFEILLMRYSGQGDFTVGTPVAGRERSEVGGRIGCFGNMVVLGGEVGGEARVVEGRGGAMEGAVEGDGD